MKPLKIILLTGLLLQFNCGSTCMAEYFNRTARKESSKPDRVLKTLGIKPGEAVADIGSGGGYFALRFARLTGEKGIVFAVDVNPTFLKLVAKKAREAGLKNVRTVQARKDSSGLAPGSADLIFMRNVFHHLKTPTRYFRDLRPVLRPGGRIAIIDYRPKFWIIGHNSSAKKIRKTMADAGYKLRAKYHFLPDQNFAIFGLD